MDIRTNIVQKVTEALRGRTDVEISKKFQDINIYDVTALDIQTEINRLSKEHSPKTVRNYHGFILAALGIFCPNLRICTTLPQKVKNEPYIPSDESIRQILEYAKRSQF